MPLNIDGRPVQALAGGTLLVALLTNGVRVREIEFGEGARAGFCLTGACQDCWVWTESGERLRACSTPVRPGLALLTRPPSSLWPMTPIGPFSIARFSSRRWRSPPDGSVSARRQGDRGASARSATAQNQRTPCGSASSLKS